MKIAQRHTISLLFALQFFCCSAFGQGRVVINEFMAWSGCSTTSEFIELLNFGPGPMDIGCYIVTNGKYSVTIPPNTIIQPGQYFVLSGQDVLPKSCGNQDSAIHVDLNWTTCNCTNVPVPTTGDGFMKDGGSANEKVILLDPSLNVIDAVSRNIPVSSSVPITTPSLSGGCSSHSFDLTTMNVSYETIGNSTGIDNSYARKVDGDCGWVKTPAISAHAPNKTNNTSSATYNFSTLSASQCNGTTGSISIQVSASDVNSLFPMNYTLGYDVDGDGVFESTDVYTYGVDNSAPSIDISNLAYGRYRITVGSSSSCNLKSYDFFIFNCYGIVLPVKLLSFAYQGIENNRHLFHCKIDEASTLSSAVLEGSDGGSYQPVASLFSPFPKNEFSIAANLSSYQWYRLKLVNQAAVVFYSQIIKIENRNGDGTYWPNPVKEKLFFKTAVLKNGKLSCTIFNASGAAVKRTVLEVNAGEQVLCIPAENLDKGLYYLNITGVSLAQPLSFKFVK